MFLGDLKKIVFKEVELNKPYIIESIFLEILNNEDFKNLLTTKQKEAIKKLIEKKTPEEDIEIEKENLNIIFKKILDSKTKNKIGQSISSEDFVYYILLNKPSFLISNIVTDNDNIENFKKEYLNKQLSLAKDNDFVLNLIKKTKEKYKEDFIDDIKENNKDKNALNKYTKNLNKKFENYKSSPLIGRIEDKKSLLRSLERQNKNNPLLIGDSGVGKTALIEGLAYDLTKNKLKNSSIKNSIIYELDSTMLMAGAKYRGDLEERFQEVLEILSKEDNGILFIDDIDLLISGGSNNNTPNISGILKPFLLNNKIKVIAASSFEKISKTLNLDKSFERLFNKITISKIDKSEVYNILIKRKKEYESYHDVKYSKKILEEIINLSDRYLSDKNFPDKALDLMDDIGVLSKEKKEKSITIKTLKKVLGLKIGSDISLIETQNTILKSLNLNLKKKIIGQNNVIDKITDALIVSKLGLIDQEKPENIFLFLGSTGVGKTELVKEISRNLNINMIRMDMSEYSDKMSLTKLTGSAPGYMDSENGGELTNSVKRNPESIILLDEIEKADKAVFNLLLQVFDNGFLTDGKGEKIDFRHTTIIMTSNIGLNEEHSKKSIGFNSQENLEEYTVMLEKYLPLEFINRIDEVLNFNFLTEKVIKDIIDLKLNELKVNIERKGYLLTFDKSIVSFILKNSYEKKFGARQINRFINKNIMTVIAKDILYKKRKNGDILNLEIKNNKIEII